MGQGDAHKMPFAGAQGANEDTGLALKRGCIHTRGNARKNDA